MKRVVLLGLGSLAFAAATHPVAAAELPVKAPLAKVPVAHFDWTGFYFGGHAGYGRGNGDTAFLPLPDAVTFAIFRPMTLSADPQGVFGGAQAGYNWQLSTRWLAGIEVDISASGIDGTSPQSSIYTNNGFLVLGGAFAATSHEVDWFGSLRGRLGILAFDNLLLYGTGGLAFGHITYAGIVDYRPSGTNALFSASSSRTKVGWAAGAGAEWKLGDAWSAKIEYLYYDLGGASVTANQVPLNPPFQMRFDSETRFHTIRVGLNYKFGGRR